jgi:hypothetical protein
MSLTFKKGRKFVSRAGEVEPPLPSVFRMARNFGSAVVRSVKSVARGNPLKVSDETKAKRQEICRSNKCNRYRKSDDRCALCGCPASARGLIEAKTGLFAEFCILNFWGSGEMKT